MAGVTRLSEGGGGVDGVSPTAQPISRVQELRVRHSLQKHQHFQFSPGPKRCNQILF